MKLESLDRDHYYHIYNRGINGGNIFINDENKKYFLKLLDKYIVDKCSVFAYCLMNNHFHLLVRIDVDEVEATQSLSNLFNAYAKAFNKTTERTGSLFEKHFKRIRIEDEDYLRKLVVYIHMNPRVHFEEDFEHFRFSSYQAFLSDRDSKIERNEVLEIFGGLDNFIYLHKHKLEFLNEKYILE